MIKKVKGGHVVVHCSGKNRGKRVSATPKPVSKEKAKSIHKAIQSGKARGRKRK